MYPYIYMCMHVDTVYKYLYIYILCIYIFYNLYELSKQDSIAMTWLIVKSENRV